MFNWIRNKFTGKPAKAFPNTFEVMVSIRHPQVINHIITMPFKIDAHDSEHARKRLRKELTMVIGHSRKVKIKH